MVIEGSNPGSAIQVFSGGMFDPLNPDPEQLKIVDIAHALAHQNRFNGHPGRSYSTAEHSVHVSMACGPEDAMWGLLHDAPEFALGDWPTPLKHSPIGEAYCKAENVLMAAVCQRFNLPEEQPLSVSRADRAMLDRERKVLFANHTPESEAAWAKWKESCPDIDDSWLPDHCTPQWWGPEVAEQIFLDRFRQLGGVL